MDNKNKEVFGILLAAIDVGSNAVRLLLSRVIEDDKITLFHEEELIRMPVRLGEDVFLEGRISDKKIQQLIYTMRAYYNIMEVYDVKDYRAVATSAMRDSFNKDQVVKIIEEETNIKIEILDGKTEANLIFANHIEEVLNPENSYMYIDVGGGSTEISLYSMHRMIASKSFNIGTLRLLYNKVSEQELEEMRKWIKKNTKGIRPLYAIGSGGNINKLYKMVGKKGNRFLSYNKLKGLYEMLENYSYEERIKLFGLKPDRADVIVPAAKIYLNVMKSADIEKIFVPEVGLLEGVVRSLYNDMKKENSQIF